MGGRKYSVEPRRAEGALTARREKSDRANSVYFTTPRAFSQSKTS